MIRTILIDDEAAALNAIEKKLEIYCDGIDILCACDSSKDGLKAIVDHKPDLIFLDIEMPWMNGFELLSCLGDNLDFHVVFVTAYDQYAIQAFKVKAIDYLLKPVDKDDLINCIQRVKSEMQRMDRESLSDLIEEMDTPMHLKKVMIHSTEGIEVLEMQGIIYCEAASNYTYIYTTQDRKIVVSKTLAEIEKILDPKSFIRSHKSYTVNLNQIQRYSSTDGGELVLKNGKNVPVSRRKKDEVLQIITNLN